MISGRPMRRIAVLAGTAAVASACAVLLSPMTASAATDPVHVQLSSDGVSYSASLTTPLYSPTLRVIPQSSLGSAFWVRNDSPEDAYLRVVISDVTTTNADLLSVLSLQADTPASTGSPVALSSARPCRVITQGTVLTPGSAVRVGTTLDVGDLLGSAGQGGVVSVALQVGLSSVDPSGIPATTCVVEGASVPVFTPPSSTPGDAAPTASTPTSSGAAASGSSSPRASSGSAVGATVGATEQHRDGLAPMPVPDFLIAAFNTVRFYQEDVVLLWVMAALIGALIVFHLSRRRRRADEKNGVSE